MARNSLVNVGRKTRLPWDEEGKFLYGFYSGEFISKGSDILEPMHIHVLRKAKSGKPEEIAKYGFIQIVYL